MKAEINGTCDPRFTEVASAFRRNFEEGPEVGASVCVYWRGRPVVDLWGGIADLTTRRPWEQDSITILASTSKGLAATAAMLLKDRSQLDLDSTVAAYWPEYAQQGKGKTLVRWLLSHRAGVAALDRPLTIEEELAYEPVIDAIAAQKPWWKPGTAHGYHAFTFGYAVSELIRRITGMRLAQFFRKEIAEPLRLDLHIGVAPADRERIAPMIGPTNEKSLAGLDDPAYANFNAALADPESLLFKATFGARTAAFEAFSHPQRPAVEDASGGAYGNAASLARMYAALIGEVDGIRLITDKTIELARTIGSSGNDEVLRLHTDWGLGFMLPGGPMWRSFGARAFGHGGASGSMAFADPDNGVAFGYVPNKWAELAQGRGDRFPSLIRATYSALSKI